VQLGNGLGADHPFQQPPPDWSAAINITRFPRDSVEEQEAEEAGWLLRAADLVGQLGDPNYLKKSNALFYEFEECGLNRQLGYTSPTDIVERYPHFSMTALLPGFRSRLGI
jgi:hypothetical protein